MGTASNTAHREPWNRGKVVGQKAPVKLQERSTFRKAAGCRVEIPRERVCCGRPYYDFGLLDRAKRALERVMEAIGTRIAAGVAVVGLEPSCVAVFKDELLQLFPDDERA